MRWLVVVLSMVGCTASESAANQSALGSAPEVTHQAWLVEWSTTGVTLIDRKVLAGPLQRLKHPVPGSWRIDVLDAAGVVRSSVELQAPNVVSAEGEGAPVRHATGRFQVRVPSDAAATRAEVWAQHWTLEPTADATWVKLGGFELSP